jgi:hypothetical protein
LLEWEDIERRNKIKIRKKWKFHEKRLLQDRGIWQVEEDSEDIIRYKIDKSEDSMRRRMRLQRDHQAINREYLSVTAYQQKLKSKQESNEGSCKIQIVILIFLVPIDSLTELNLPSPQNGSQGNQSPSVQRRGSLKDVLVFSPQATQTSIDDISAMTPRRKVQVSEPLPEFLSIPKEEVLAEIQEKHLEMDITKRKKTVQKWRHKCEKIALKGAVYGEIEITESKHIIVTPLESERPDDPPYSFGALVILYYYC